MMDPSLYTSRELAAGLAAAIASEAAGLPPLKIMHVCGTHEHELGRWALRKLLPANLKLIAGPGCPVCITPAAAIATAIKLATSQEQPLLAAYGDVARVPIGQGSLFEARAKGADVRIVYGPRDAVKLAQDNPSRVTVFFSVGFETTAAPVASLLKGQLSPNFLVYFCHRYVPAAVEVLASDPETAVNGYLLPGHACVITGTRAYDYLPRRLHKPAAAAGFEPVDILAGLLSILRQVRQGNPVVANCYPRAVSAEGNLKAQAALDEVFVRTDAAWRGIGVLPGTGFELREKYRRYDALARLGLSEESAEDILPGCSCHLIMTGRREPRECGLFGKACAPDHPRGPCMVGAEGTCRAHYLFPEDEDV